MTEARKAVDRFRHDAEAAAQDALHCRVGRHIWLADYRDGDSCDCGALYLDRDAAGNPTALEAAAERPHEEKRTDKAERERATLRERVADLERDLSIAAPELLDLHQARDKGIKAELVEARAENDRLRAQVQQAREALTELNDAAEDYRIYSELGRDKDVPKVIRLMHARDAARALLAPTGGD